MSVEEQGVCAAAPRAELSDRAARVKKALYRRGSFTEIMYKTLDFCRARRSYASVEDEIASYPEFKYADQSQASIIEILVHEGGLAKTEFDANGEEVTSQRKSGLSDDELDELVWSYALETTDAGKVAIGRLSPKDRMAVLFAKEPNRTPAYEEILRACETPKSFKELEALMSDSQAIKAATSRNRLSSLPVFPSALIAELEAAGGLLWNDAWVLTSAGKQYV